MVWTTEVFEFQRGYSIEFLFSASSGFKYVISNRGYFLGDKVDGA
jgi:hypothetical protein